mmetsp:Transcript_25322/g.53804  ORF Transcript_25322/g.53804 Transcript_25322/m.53804 type:complete len:92 (-) Transcript_25322:998-1273(-)
MGAIGAAAAVWPRPIIPPPIKGLEAGGGDPGMGGRKGKPGGGAEDDEAGNVPVATGDDVPDRAKMAIGEAALEKEAEPELPGELPPIGGPW